MKGTRQNSGKVWLDVIGVPPSGIDGLDEEAHQRLAHAKHIIASKRLLPALNNLKGNLGLAGRCRPWPSPFADLYPLLRSWRGEYTVLLATGDPLWHGVATSLTSHFPPEEIRVTPAISAFQLAASRMLWTLEEVVCLSLHARPLAYLSLVLMPGVRLLLLANDGKTPAEVAGLLVAAGYGDAVMTAMAHIGMAEEASHTATAKEWLATKPLPSIADFHVLAVACPLGVEFYPTTPGLGDGAYKSDGTLTKAEVRAITLANLAPAPGQLLWDLGCGAGSVGIEWMRGAKGAMAIGVDRREDRLKLARENACRLGVPDWRGVLGDSYAAVDGLPQPDAVFIGGGIDGQLVGRVLARLKAGGRLVANVVTLEGEAVVGACFDKYGGRLTRIAISHASSMAGQAKSNHQIWRATTPLTQWVWHKQNDEGEAK
ncbi:MAG: precorrin-6y C5,15-methyltransferase (decarboxylating) subunit CbiE [Proteobacteria bacterium]|nr:precorrin-6y C5,15-methyltransferase (decarboxylating) subunit CbiE [Pseudomonadota bacterium]